MKDVAVLGYDLSGVKRRSDETPLQAAICGKRLDFRAAIILGVVLAAFIALQLWLPLGTAIKIGADEDYELSKATLCNHGYRLYTEIWDDQPPLVTFIIVDLLKHFSNSVLAPRLFTVGMALLLLSAVFSLLRSVSGLVPAAVGTTMLVTSPGFLELSSSVMQEIPALAPVVAALCVLWVEPRNRWRGVEVVAGLIFGFGLQMKMIGAAYLPLAGLMLWLRERVWVNSATQASCNGVVAGSRARPLRARIWAALLEAKPLLARGLVFGASIGVSFVVLNFLTGNSLLLEFRQSWAAHFAAVRSFEYGSPNQYHFDWALLIKNWETTLPAALGLCVLLGQVRRRKEALIPIGWLFLTFGVFSMHKPWWAYYYIHNALPLCWLAGVGIAFAWQWSQSGRGEQQLSKQRRMRRERASTLQAKGRLAKRRMLGHIVTAGVVLFGLCAGSWMVARVYLEGQAMQRAPKLYSSLVLQEIERFKPFTKFMFSDQPIYSFHADITMPPHLAVLSLKRLWSGDMSNARLTAELIAIKPGLILLGNTSGEVSFQELLNGEYRLVYQDNKDRLYALASIARKPPLRGL